MTTANQVTESTTATAGQDAGPSDVDYRLADIAITLESAVTVLHTLSPAEAVSAVDAMLQGASASLEKVLSATKRETGPKLEAVDAPRDPRDLAQALNDLEGAQGSLRGLYRTVDAMATSDSDEAGLRDCLRSIKQLIEPIQNEVFCAADLIGQVKGRS